MATLYSFGHSSHTEEQFHSSLNKIGIDVLVDVRSNPSSWRFPQFAMTELESSCAKHGREYKHLGSQLGGRGPGGANIWKHLEFKEGTDALQQLVNMCQSDPSKKISIMCSEGDWRTCHRSVISNEISQREGMQVVHILRDGSLEKHITVTDPDTDSGVLKSLSNKFPTAPVVVETAKTAELKAKAKKRNRLQSNMAQAASPTPTESVNVSDLLDPVVVPPNKKFPFPVHFFADVTQHLGYKKEKKRIHIPKKGKLKKDRCLLVTAKQIRLCSRTSGSEKYKYPIIDIEGVVLIGNSQLGIFTSEDEKSDLLLELKNSIARGKAIRSIELLRAINSKTETKEFKVWNLLNDSTASDVIRLAGKGIIGRDDYLTPANNSSSCSSIQRDKSFTHRLSSAPSPPPSSYTSGPSGSPPQSPVSVTSTAAASSTRGIVTFSDYGSYEEAVSRCKSLEIVVSELRGEMSGLKAILEHVNHRKEEGILQAARLRQQFEDERTRELVDEVKHLRTVVASVQSENQSLSRRLSEFRHFQSPTLLSRHVSRGTVPSNFNSPTSTLWSSSGYPIDTNNRRLEDEFDRELIKEKRVLHEAKNYYYPNPAPPTPQQDDLT